MNFKVPSGAGSADFGGKTPNQINKMPDKNAHEVPLPPAKTMKITTPTASSKHTILVAKKWAKP